MGFNLIHTAQLVYFLRSIWGGMLLAMATAIFLFCDCGVIGAILFAIGLLTIMRMRGVLYTAEIGVVNSNTEMLFNLIALLCNFIGCLIIFAFPAGNAVTIWAAKTSGSVITTLAQSFLCGVLVFFCRYMERTEDGSINSTLCIILAVMAFMLGGGQHCIANFGIMLAARAFDLISIGYMLLTIIGNSVGAIVAYRMCSISDWVKERLEQAYEVMHNEDTSDPDDNNNEK